MKLPAYPLVTVDPFFSIWSMSDELYNSDTQLWCGIKKRLTGYVTVDGVKFRFMGKGMGKTLLQTNLKVLPYKTVYTFENDVFMLKTTFWTPLIINNIHLLSLPCSFIDYECKSKDGKSHNVTISFSMAEEFCYDKNKKPIEKSVVNTDDFVIGKMGQTQQKPLSKSGDGVSVDWGYFYLAGEQIKFNDTVKKAVESVHTFNLTDCYECGDIVAFDDVLSIEVFGDKVKSVWTEKFETIQDAIVFCKNNRLKLLKQIDEQTETVLNDAKKFGESYQQVLTAAARQVLAAHKLIRNKNDNLLYFSKECHSNGCVNTVDVTYPALPMFLCYNPELVKAMLTAIFDFSRMPCWKFDYAPHDIGTYPIANGQVYALKDDSFKKRTIDRNTVYKNTGDIFDFNSQMPVEECGNMIICAYAYYFITKDDSQIKENSDLLEKWADYLKNTGIVLENQLCTDDFAGHVSKNVNLAIKSIMAIKCFEKICGILGSTRGSEFAETAQSFAIQLCKLARENDYLTFSLDNKNSWSLKYNLVWDILFDFNLFDKEIYDGESRLYLEKLNQYGTPLDYRENFTKSDWLVWASVLDKTEKNTAVFSSAILKYLRDTKDKNCFTDWFCTDKPKEKGMNHRSVQAGLWMPVLKEKFNNLK